MHNDPSRVSVSRDRRFGHPTKSVTIYRNRRSHLTEMTGHALPKSAVTIGRNTQSDRIEQQRRDDADRIERQRIERRPVEEQPAERPRSNAAEQLERNTRRADPAPRETPAESRKDARDDDDDANDKDEDRDEQAAERRKVRERGER